MPKTTAWLIRHGQSSSNIGIWSSKPHEIALTDEGRRQALLIADQMINKPDRIITSPMNRAIQTADPTIKKWPDVPVETWPIQEFTYLSPSKHQLNTAAERKICVSEYWKQANPLYCDGDDCESFSAFVERLESFYKALLMQTGFLVVFGHGQFFKAFILGCEHGFCATSSWMTSFRQQEVAKPLLNGEILHWYHR